MSKGIFRFVGGSLGKKPDGVTLKTTTATIGLRGGIAMFEVDGGEMTIVMPYGQEMTVRTANSSQTIRRNEYGVTVTPDGRVSAPGRAATRRNSYRRTAPSRH